MQLLHFLAGPDSNAFNTATILLSAGLLLNRKLAARGFSLPHPWVIGAEIAAWLAIAAYAGLIVVSQRLGFADHLQASVASVAWMAVHGHPIYPSLDGGDLYAMIYGPLLFWLNGLVLRLVPGIAPVTLFSAAALLAGIAVTWRVLLPALGNRAAGILLAALMAEQLVPFQFDGFWNRGEPFLYLVAALSLAATSIPGDMRAILTVGLLAGLAADIKLTALLCTAPAGLMILARAQGWRRRFTLASAAAMVGIAALAIPVLIDPSVILLYRVYLPLASGHGLTAHLIRVNFSFAVAMAMPILLPLMWRRPRLSRADIWAIGGIFAALAAEAILGSKAQSGPYHLIPLLPWTAYGAMRAMTAPSRLDTAPGTARNQLTIVFGILFIANMAPLANAYIALRDALASLPQARIAALEFQAQLDRHPDAESGTAGLPTYGLTYIRPLQVIRNSRLHLDIGAWMDLAEGGVDEAKARRFIESCAVPTWLLPNGEPFSMISYYTERPLFSDAFRAVFARNYTVAEQGRYYSVWRCKTGSVG